MQCTRIALTATIALTTVLAAACGPEDDTTSIGATQPGVHAETGAAVVESTTAASGAESTAAAAEPEVVGQDPCAGLPANGSMCRVVATAPMTNASTHNPIAVGITTGPTYEVRVGLPDGVASYSVYPGSTSGIAPAMGPGGGDFAAKQDKALEAVADITGDGSPEIVFWTGEYADHNDFQVLSLENGKLVVVNNPTYSKWGNPDLWPTYHGEAFDYVRCNPVQAGVQPGSITRVTGKTQGTASEHNYTHNPTGTVVGEATVPWTPAATASGLPIPAEAQNGTNFDCRHLETRIDRQSGDKTTPFTPRTPEAQPAGLCVSEPARDGSALDIRNITGPLDCASAQRIRSEYNHSDFPASGNAAHRQNAEWHCSTNTAGELTRTGKIGTCSNATTPSEWQFEVYVTGR